MKPKLSSRQSFTLYGIVLGFLLFFYVLGLLIGKNYFGVKEAAVERFPISTTPVPDVKSQLDFYQQVVVPPPSAARKPSTAQPETPAPGKKTTPEPAGAFEYTIQVGALSTEEDAQQILIRLEAKGYSGRVQLPQGEADRYYRVLVGEFDTAERARRMQARLKEDRFPTFIKKLEVRGAPSKTKTSH